MADTERPLTKNRQLKILAQGEDFLRRGNIDGYLDLMARHGPYAA